jgi:hypothetical protein
MHTQMMTYLSAGDSYGNGDGSGQGQGHGHRVGADTNAIPGLLSGESNGAGLTF